MRGFYYEVLDIKSAVGSISQTDVAECIKFLRINPPIYGKDGLYYVLRKELFALEDEVVKPLLQLYSDLVKLYDIQLVLREGGKLVISDPHVALNLVVEVTRQLDDAQSLLSLKLNEEK